VQPRSTALICGGRDIINLEGIDTDKSIKDETLSALIAGPLWKSEKQKKEKKKE